MLTFKSVVAFLVCYVPSVFASYAGFSDNSDILISGFLSLCGFIIVLQAIPAIVLFINILMGLFGFVTRIPVKDYKLDA